MHEFFKAGWYDGNGKYRELSEATRNDASRYGIVKHASGLREHMENKYHAGAPFVLGADDASTDAAALNTARLWQQPEYAGSAAAGFRVAATASLQVGDRLNLHNNFFFDPAEKAMLRIRSDAPARKAVFRLELRDYANRPVWSKRVEPELKPGVTGLGIDLPKTDGYYELTVTPEDASFNGQSEVIPLAVMYDSADNGATGNFGFTCHITRRERRFSFEEFDFELLRRLGVSQVRVDVGHDDSNGSQTVLKRIRAAGLNPLAIISTSGLRNYDLIAKNRAEHPELVEKWAKQGVPADFAWYAEQVYNLVSANKDAVHDWEFGNEPTYWRILPEDYAQVLKAGYKAAKLADPGCNVMAGDLNAIHAPVFRTGGAEFCDSIASHIYGFYVPMFWGIAGKMRELNGWKNAAGIPDNPVWITEIGGCTYNSMHMPPAAKALRPWNPTGKVPVPKTFFLLDLLRQGHHVAVVGHARLGALEGFRPLEQHHRLLGDLQRLVRAAAEVKHTRVFLGDLPLLLVALELRRIVGRTAELEHIVQPQFRHRRFHLLLRELDQQQRLIAEIADDPVEPAAELLRTVRAFERGECQLVERQLLRILGDHLVEEGERLVRLVHQGAEQLRLERNQLHVVRVKHQLGIEQLEHGRVVADLHRIHHRSGECLALDRLLEVEFPRQHILQHRIEQPGVAAPEQGAVLVDQRRHRNTVALAHV